MNKAIIDISEITSPDLRSRLIVRDFDLYIQNLNISDVIVDFSKVKFATRSFIDEFYNVFIKAGANKVNVKLENVSPDLQAIFEAVKLTQTRPKSKGNNTGSVVYLDSMEEVKEFFNTLAL